MSPDTAFKKIAPSSPEEDHEQQQSQRRRKARLLGFAAVTILAGLVGFGVWSKVMRGAEAVAVMEARESRIPSVRTIIVTADAKPREIELTGNMTAFDAATIFARATGYISVRNVDIGSKVKKGDVLAVISAPDLDHQLDQARAQLVQMQAAVEQAKATADLSRVTSSRTSRLVAQGWSSQQQGDQDRLTFASQTAAVAVARANVIAQQAAVNRLEQLTQFEQITAPFNGVITSRLIDVGSLVAADANTGTPLFSIARTDVLRVQVFVPQASTFGIQDGDPATVTVSELPGQVFRGRVARDATALSPGTRTLLIEVDVDNKNGVLRAGLYSVIHLQVKRASPVVVIPSQAVIFNKDGLLAAVVSDGKVEFRKLDLEVDNGATLEVRAGLKPGDRVIVSPPANLSEGMAVKAT